MLRYRVEAHVYIQRAGEQTIAKTLGYFPSKTMAFRAIRQARNLAQPYMDPPGGDTNDTFYPLHRIKEFHIHEVP